MPSRDGELAGDLVERLALDRAQARRFSGGAEERNGTTFLDGGTTESTGRSSRTRWRRFFARRCFAGRDRRRSERRVGGPSATFVVFRRRLPWRQLGSRRHRGAAARGDQFRQTRDVAANAEAAIAAEELRSPSNTGKPDISTASRSFASSTGQSTVIGAQGFARFDGARDLAFGVETKRGGDFVPWPAQCRGGARPDRPAEFVRAEREAAIGVHLPEKAQRLLARRAERGALRRSLVARGIAPAPKV